MSHSTRITTAASALALAGVFLLGVLPTAQARPDPGPSQSAVDNPSTLSPEVRELLEGGFSTVDTVEEPLVRRVEIDDGALEPLQLGVAALAGAAAAAGAVVGGQRLNRRRFA